MFRRPSSFSSASSAALFLVAIVVSACTGDDPQGVMAAPDGGVPSTATTCGVGAPCANGAPCVDGFCCDGACAGTCEACNVAGQEGRCAPVSGKPVHGTCAGDEAGPCAGGCDGKERASCTFPSVECGAPAACAGGVASVRATCKAGTCPASTSQTCALGCLEDGCLGVKQVAGGYYHACAVLTDKRVRCWGSNSHGQTGESPSTPVTPRPAQVLSLSNVESIAATFNSTCALLSNKTVTCWGSNGSGELGRGVTDSAAHETPMVVAGLTDVSFLAGSSAGHFCAIVAGGGLRCWGSNYDGQLGDGSQADNKPTPVTVCQPNVAPCTPATGATFVAGGDNHTCATFDGGKVACWGGNAEGQLGQPVNPSRPMPVYLDPPVTATYLTAGNRITCAASGGAAKCWGANYSGRLGNAQEMGTSVQPVSVCTKSDCSALLSGVTAVTTFDESSCALAGGAVRCWGVNTGGQLGDGNATASQSYAASTAIAAGVVQVASGGQVNFAVVVDGANRDVRCWGNEGSNQCGDGATSTARRTPIAPKW